MGFASVLAGQASRTTSKVFLSGKLEMPSLKEFKWSNVDVEEMVLDAVLGMCFYKVSCSPVNLTEHHIKCVMPVMPVMPDASINVQSTAFHFALVS